MGIEASACAHNRHCIALHYIVMIILSFAMNHSVVDIVSSCVKDTVVLIVDLIFTERIVNLWNTLPPDIVNFNSL